MNHGGHQNGTKIRRLREDAKISVSELARRIGITPQSMSNIELQNKPVSLGTLLKIAGELGQSLDALTAREDDADAEAEPEPEMNGAAA